MYHAKWIKWFSKLKGDTDTRTQLAQRIRLFTLIRSDNNQRSTNTHNKQDSKIPCMLSRPVSDVAAACVPCAVWEFNIAKGCYYTHGSHVCLSLYAPFFHAVFIWMSESVPLRCTHYTVKMFQLFYSTHTCLAANNTRIYLRTQSKLHYSCVLNYKRTVNLFKYYIRRKRVFGIHILSGIIGKKYTQICKWNRHKYS